MLVAVPVAVEMDVKVDVGVKVGVGEDVCTGVDVDVNVQEAVAVEIELKVEVGVKVGVGEDVSIAVDVDVNVQEAVAVEIGLKVEVAVKIGVGEDVSGQFGTGVEVFVGLVMPSTGGMIVNTMGGKIDCASTVTDADAVTTADGHINDDTCGAVAGELELFRPQPTTIAKIGNKLKMINFPLIFFSLRFQEGFVLFRPANPFSGEAVYLYFLKNS